MSHALTLMQWLSPAFPVGAFAYSHGLEQVIADGVVTDAPSLQDWLAPLVQHGSGWADAVLLAVAHRADTGADAEAAARAFAASAERLQETDLQGAAFCQTARSVWGVEIDGLTYPVAVGRAAGIMGIPLAETLPMYLHAFASNLVSVAQRAMPLGQTDGQRVLAALTPVITDTATRAETATLDDLSATSFAADIAAMRHETLTHRIFRT
ncbi:urease accessory protein UreF [uncultured Tateyamaria sp.]|uniref:urease accessory protein UreF n=1 Tax=uncultured Tateyamaria sp. TaxID=455651 RepID=UPI002634C15F|nr:urease accessory protein UreF [uncultured Tateyamaria sp.]